jgi:hypothetical protein
VRGPPLGRRSAALATAGLAAGLAPPYPARAATAFPIRVAPDRRYLVDGRGEPFLLHGDTAWSLIVQLRLEEATHYLRDRQRRGFNTLLVNLIEHRFASRAPANLAGDAPFLRPGDFGAPNEAYFAHADRVLALAAELGFLVLLAPAYLGTSGGPEGWYRAMAAAGPAKLQAYGAFLGRRYARFRNILWVHGGDYNPPDPSLVRAVAAGIRREDRDALHTAHCDPETAAAEFWNAEPWLALDTVYTYQPVYRAVRRAAAREPRRPFILLESTYENEHRAGPDRIRTQAYQALLGGACGQVFGNNPIWHFDTPGARDAPVNWRQALDGPGTRGMQHLLALFSRLPWWRLVPDAEGALLRDPGGDVHGRRTAAMTEDRRRALVHFPTALPATLDLGRFAGESVFLRWFDPSAGTTGATIGPLPRASGEVRVTPPGRNAAGQGDWLLEASTRAP